MTEKLSKGLGGITLATTSSPSGSETNTRWVRQADPRLSQTQSKSASRAAALLKLGHMAAHSISWLLQQNIHLQLQLELSWRKLPSLTSQAARGSSSMAAFPPWSRILASEIITRSLLHQLSAVPSFAAPGSVKTLSCTWQTHEGRQRVCTKALGSTFLFPTSSPPPAPSHRLRPRPAWLTEQGGWCQESYCSVPKHCSSGPGAERGVPALQPTQPLLPPRNAGWRWAGECFGHTPKQRLRIPGNWPRLGLQMQPWVFQFWCSQ